MPPPFLFEVPDGATREPLYPEKFPKIKISEEYAEIIKQITYSKNKDIKNKKEINPITNNIKLINF